MIQTLVYLPLVEERLLRFRIGYSHIFPGLETWIVSRCSMMMVRHTYIRTQRTPRAGFVYHRLMRYLFPGTLLYLYQAQWLRSLGCSMELDGLT